MQSDNFDDEIDELPIIDEPLGYCLYCNNALFEPEELDTRFCCGGECEEKYHNQIEFE